MKNRSNRGKLPSIVFVSPIGEREKHRFVIELFEVIKVDADGLPTEFRLLRDTDTVDLDSPPEHGGKIHTFVTGYMSLAIRNPVEKG